MTEKFKKSLDFVVRYYRPDAFRPDAGLFRTQVRRPWWRRGAIAASVIAATLVASACFYTFVLKAPAPAPVEGVSAPVETAATPTAKPTAQVSKIEFSDTPLADVVKEIEKVYGVEITGLPENGEYRLTLSYEGTATDLVETINEILGTGMKVNTENKL